MATEHNSTIGYHIVNGAFEFSYPVDRNHAVANHPHEWSKTPWTAERADKARAARKAQHDREVAAGVKEPVALIPDAAPLDPENQAALDQHTQAQREAADRLAAFDKAEAERKQLEEQVAADRALVAAPPPAPDPNIRRPFGRKGEPTEKEREMMTRRAEKAEAEKAETVND